MKKLWYALPAIPIAIIVATFGALFGIAAGYDWWVGIIAVCVILVALSLFMGLLASTAYFIGLADKKNGKL